MLASFRDNRKVGCFLFRSGCRRSQGRLSSSSSSEPRVAQRLAAALLGPVAVVHVPQERGVRGDNVAAEMNIKQAIRKFITDSRVRIKSVDRDDATILPPSVKKKRKKKDKL
jgi:hypothetical protein